MKVPMSWDNIVKHNGSRCIGPTQIMSHLDERPIREKPNKTMFRPHFKLINLIIAVFARLL